MADVKLVVETLLTQHGLPFEPTAIRLPRKQVPRRHETLCLGLMFTDGVVEPQPAITRALRETSANLQEAGHEVVAFSPFDCWEVARSTWQLWFQIGAKETLALIAASEEPLYPTFKWYLETFDIKSSLYQSCSSSTLSKPNGDINSQKHDMTQK